MDILRTMTVIQHPDGQVEMDRDMKGRWFKHSGENMSRSEWMHRFRPRCKLRRVHVIAADSGAGEHISQQRHAASPKGKPCPTCNGERVVINTRKWSAKETCWACGGSGTASA